MIGRAGLPMAQAVATAPSPKPHAPAEEREAAMPASPRADTLRPPAHEAHSPHHAEGEAKRHDDERDARPAGHGRRDDSRTTASRRATHATNPSREPRDDDAPHEDAFARLLEPAGADKTSAATDKPTAPASNADAPDKASGTSALPEQLLGLLAALVPGANAGAATTPATTAGAQPATTATTGPQAAALPAAIGTASNAPASQAGAAAAPAAQPAMAPAGDEAAAGNGSDALAALLPALQDKAAGVPAAATATTHAEAGAASTTAPQAGSTTDAPTTQGFDALLQVPSTTSTPVAANNRPIASAPAPLAQPADPRAGYDDAFGGNVVWMAEQRLGHAQLHVSPEHLGPIEVRLQLDGSQVQASFLSAQPDVRHALEASLPRLRELLGQHGLQLAQADVGQRQPDGRSLPTQQRSPDGRDPADDGLAPSLPPRIRVVRGLLDEYA